MNNNLVEYTCPNCKHDWAILLGIYTPQRLISKSDKSDKDAYVHIIKDEDGNVVNKTWYRRREGYCRCGQPFRPIMVKETIWEFFKRVGVKV